MCHLQYIDIPMLVPHCLSSPSPLLPATALSPSLVIATQVPIASSSARSLPSHKLAAAVNQAMREHGAQEGTRAQPEGCLPNRGVEVKEAPEMPNALAMAFDWLRNAESSLASSAGSSDEKYVLCVTGSLHAAAAILKLQQGVNCSANMS